MIKSLRKVYVCYRLNIFHIFRRLGKVDILQDETFTMI